MKGKVLKMAETKNKKTKTKKTTPQKVENK